MSENDEIGNDWADALNEQAGADWGEAMKEQQAGANPAGGYAAAEFPNLEDLKQKNYTNSDEVKLDVILDVPVTVSLEIGRTKINIRWWNWIDLPGSRWMCW